MKYFHVCNAGRCQLNEEIDERDPRIAKLQHVKGRIVGMLLTFFIFTVE